jgi:SepF-like predicted cell division protein (DUF552 family)
MYVDSYYDSKEINKFMKKKLQKMKKSFSNVSSGDLFDRLKTTLSERYEIVMSTNKSIVIKSTSETYDEISEIIKTLYDDNIHFLFRIKMFENEILIMRKR